MVMNSANDSLAPTHRVLVIEDNEHTAHFLEFMLNRAGYDVLMALDGHEAQKFLGNVEPVDIILLDLMLPYVSGFELIIEIRDNPEWRYVPILVVSGKVLEQDIVKALDLGANDYVTKPFRPQELLARMRRLVATREAQELLH